MSIYGIGDLHLSFTANKPMDVFGGQWTDHVKRVKEKWENLVEEGDTVILPGDLSWGLAPQEAKADLDFIASLPGKKVLLKGNHDLWWSSITRLNQMYDNMYFLQNQHYVAGKYAVCGSRGWICPGTSDYTEHDEKIYRRELLRLRMSLESAVRAGQKEILGALHYPPLGESGEETGFSQLFEEFGAGLVVYGHLHGQEAHSKAFQGNHNGVEYRLVSCDYLTCCPLLLRK